MKSTNTLMRVMMFTVITCLLTAVLNAQERRFFMGDNTDAKELDRIARPAERATRDMENPPASFSLKRFAPPVGDQGEHGTCVAWSSSYAARTISYCIQRNMTDPDKIRSVSFSPGY